jgi:hypothetical protein
LDDLWVETELTPSLLQQGADAFHHSAWFSVETGTGDSSHLDPVQLEILLAQSITLEGGGTSVSLVNVELDHETLLLPIGVELILALDKVHAGTGNPAART